MIVYVSIQHRETLGLAYITSQVNMVSESVSQRESRHGDIFTASILKEQRSDWQWGYSTFRQALTASLGLGHCDIYQ